MRISIVEDDHAQAQLVKQWLEGEGHEVDHYPDSRVFVRSFHEYPRDLLILDWEMPNLTGIDVLRSVRGTLSSDIPVLFATQRDNEEDVVAALKSGADDYLVKPLRHAELVARIDALKRRSGFADETDILELGPVVINTKAETVTLHGEPVKLTQKDYQLAICMLKNIGKVLSREYLLKEVWGVDVSLHTRTVDVHVSRIRRSLNIGPEIGYCIKTIYQHGYRLEKVEV